MKINNKNYTLPTLTFNNICELEKKGTPLNNIGDNYMSFLRGYLAIAMNSDIDKAGEEIEKHISAGGTIDELMKEINEQVKSSGFFQMGRISKK